jgi:hypothetical protein
MKSSSENGIMDDFRTLRRKSAELSALNLDDLQLEILDDLRFILEYAYRKIKTRTLNDAKKASWARIYNQSVETKQRIVNSLRDREYQDQLTLVFNRMKTLGLISHEAE